MIKLFYKLAVILVVLLCSCNTNKVVETILGVPKLSKSLSEIRNQVSLISEKTQVIEINNTLTPLSKNKEECLIALNMKLKSGNLDTVIFTFSDGKLSYIEMIGNVVNCLTSERKETPVKFSDYVLYPSDLLYLNPKKDRAWILNKESQHSNMFLVERSNLNQKSNKKNNSSIKIPSFIKMDEDFETLKPIFQNKSMFMNIENIGKDNQTKKFQINAYGIEFAGFPRKFEARFEDGKLNMIWILTGKGEENRLRTKLINEYGKALFVSKKWEAYNDWKILLRKDIPEILILNQELGLTFKNKLIKSKISNNNLK